MARRSITAGLIVLHLLTVVHLTGAYAQEEWSIRHQPVISAQPDTPIEIGAELEGRATGVLMYLMARKTGQKDFRSFPMSAAGDDLFEGQIPAKFSTIEGLEYYLRLQDPVGRMLARYPEDETFISIIISAAQPEEMASPPEETEPEAEPEPEQVEGKEAVPPVTPPMAPKEEETEAVAAPVPAEEEAVETAALPEEEIAEAPQPVIGEEEPTVPPEKPDIIMEEKKGGLQTWHWLGLGALAVVGIAAVAMSGGDDGGGNGRTPSSKLPDPPDHP